MFNGLEILIDKLSSFEDELNVFTSDVMQDADTITEIVELNKDQLYAGVRSDGSPITPAYKPFTVRIKQQKGQPTDRVTLNDTGEFYDQLRVKSSPGKSEVYDTDWKAEKLEEKYNLGEAVIYGLTEQSIEQLRAFILPSIISFRNHYFQ